VPAAPFDLIFLDPPWDADEEYTSTLNLLGAGSLRILASDAIVIAEHRRKQTLNQRYGNLDCYRLLEQGDAALSFYQVAEASTPTPTAVSEST
jgi:16S rRNA G966 N2-methylase RsmD